MSNLHVKYLLVGGGLAGISAARAIRARDPQGALLIIGQEINRPYHRPPLSRQYLRGQMTHEDIFTHPSSWCGTESNRFAHRAGARGWTWGG